MAKSGLTRLGVRAVALPGALALALSGCTKSSGGHGSTHSNGLPQTGRCTEQPYQRTDLLSLQMTAALQAHSKATFLKLAGPSAQSAMSTWYDNVSAVGFTTAAVGNAKSLSDGGIESGDAPKTQVATVGIGLHNAFDETLKAIVKGEVDTGDAPATEYTLGTDVIHDGNQKCHLRITSWKSVNNAPWDTSQHLKIVRTKHVVIAGDPAAAADISRVAALAEKAATFDIGLFRSFKRPLDIRLKGFVMFVPTSNAQANSWFHYPDAKKPSGWIADIGNAFGVEYPLNGVQIPVTKPVGAPKVNAVSQIGGGRVVLTSTGLRHTSSEITAVLVHEFAHDIYNNYSLGWFTGKPIDAALAEGAARYIESFYENNPNPYAFSHSMKVLAPIIRQHFSLFNGKTPTRSQVYGNVNLASYYYAVSASSFSYLAVKYGIAFAFQSIRDAYANGGGPFSGIVTRINGGNVTFGDPGPFERAWAKWLPTQV